MGREWFSHTARRARSAYLIHASTLYYYWMAV